MTNHEATNATREIAAEIYDLGITLINSGRINEAAFQFGKAIRIQPGLYDAHLALGYCLHLQRRFQEALDAYEEIPASSPLIPAALNNRGNTLLAMSRYEEAAAAFSRAIELVPTLLDAQVAMATCLQAMGRFEDAAAACRNVLAADPLHAEAHWNLSLLLLQNGDYASGWREYEWRWKKRGFTSPLREFTQKQWRGESLDGGTLLIHAEQGLGDTLQFCRYVPLVAELAGHVVFECHPPLRRLMKSLHPEVEVVSMGDPLPWFDSHTPLMSLPALMGTVIETIPAAAPYLQPGQDILQEWRCLVPENDTLRVGLCWAGKSYPDPCRSCPPDQLRPLAEIEGISWYSLQKGWNEMLPFQMSDFTGRVGDFADTAALITMMDMVITIDTSVAHLSGALGKPTWVMLPQYPDWRWMLKRDDSPWYPSAKLFRQSGRGQWRDLISRVAAELENWKNSFSR
jgi:Tfp pilus assembly protein PilF